MNTYKCPYNTSCQEYWEAGFNMGKLAKESEVNSQADETAKYNALKSKSNKRDGSLSDNIHSQINNEIGKDYVRNSDEVKK